MSEHTRRRIAFRVTKTILTAEIPVCWAIGWIRVYAHLIRSRGRPPVPALPADGVPLDGWEDEQLRRLAVGLDADWGHP